MIRTIATRFQEIPHPALVALVALLLAGIAVTATVAAYGSPAWTTAASATLFAVTLATPPVVALAKRKFDPFEPIYLWIVIYTYLYLAKPLVQIMRGIPFTYGGVYVDRALILAVLGLCVFYLGYGSGIGTRIAGRIPSIAAETSSRRLQWAAWTCILIGFLGLHFYIQHSGGWATFWSKPHGYGGQAATSTAYLYQLPELMVVGFLLLFTIFITPHRRTVRDYFLLALGSLGGIGIYTVTWGSRTLYSWILIAGAVLYYLARNRRPSIQMVLVSLAILFVILAAVPFYRSQMYLGGSISRMFDIRQYRILHDSFSAGDEFNTYLAEVALVPAVIPYGYFYFHRNLIFHPIPRLIWPDKPTTLNKYWDEFLMRSGIGRGSAETLLGDFYAQLGTFGIVIGTFIAGVFWKAAYAYLLRFPSHQSVQFVYAMLLPNMFTFLAQSSAIALLKWLPYMFPVSVLAFLISKVRTRQLPNTPAEIEA